MSEICSEGVIVGCDEKQEWLLSWWWNHYSAHNTYPVTFFDFGLTPAQKKWCKERGRLLSLTESDFIKERDEIRSTLVNAWEKRYPDKFWESRKAWFKKPMACLQSPYRKTIWVDLDCEIVKSLTPLFHASDPAKIGLAKDRTAPAPLYSIYNSGVIVFPSHHPLLLEWARQAMEKNHLFRGDQDLLSAIVSKNPDCIYELDPIFNWSIASGQHQDIAVYHWMGDAAKAILQSKIALDQLIFPSG